MRFILCILTIIACHLPCAGQTIANPVFDRTDEYRFHVKKVALTEDTTFVYCTYSAEEQSWANISEKTYLENVRNGEKFPILKVSGIPFGPDKRHFIGEEEVDVILYFPHISTDRINIIEDEEEEAFNIYGIDLNNSYKTRYSSDDIDCYFNASHKKQEEEDWYSALKYTQKQLEATNYVEGIRSFASACSMYNLTMVYFGIKDYEKMIEWGKNAIDILCTLPQDSIYLDVLARAYGNVSTAYYLIKKDETAEFYRELSLATRRIGEGIGNVSYEKYLQDLARDYYYQDNLPKALLYGKEVVDIYRKRYSENPYKYECVYISSLNNLCEFYRVMNKVEEAISCGTLALELNNRGGCNDDPWLKYAIYHNLALAFLSNGQTDEGIDLLEELLVAAKRGDYEFNRGVLNARLELANSYLHYRQDSIRALHEYESILKEVEDSIPAGKIDYPTYTNVLGKLYGINRWSNPSISMQYLDKAINVQKVWNGGHSIAYANMLIEKVDNLWIPCLTEHEGLDSLFLYTSQAAEIIKRHINNSSHNMSKKERKAYWSRYEGLFTWFIPTICGLLNIDAGNSLAYDAALFYKGMLLSSEKEFTSIIQNSNNDELIKLYQDYIYHLTELEKLYSIRPSEDAVDSLESLIHDKEFLLSQKVTRFNRHYKGTNFSWEEVKGHLRKDDIAIEFISYQGIDGQNTYYDAYVIGSNYKAPLLIHLCSEEKLRALTTDSIDFKGVSALIWGNELMHDAIKDAKNIYFATAGLLNILGLEYLPIAGNQYIYDSFNLYRLSSTRELCMKTEISSVDNAYLYGGLDYNSMAEQPKLKDSIPDRLTRSAVEALSHRGGFDLLMGSMQEVELIKSTMSKHNIECRVLSGYAGTEESMKNLSGRHLGILHLSTHGMYIPDNSDSTRNANNYRFIISEEMPYVDDEEISLSRSFLVMSGGNALIHRDSIPLENEDGILTALEISHLDLTNLDLVVLSACETALGRIETEGVYGLQRGFKKAGANTILMSLHKVDDEATQILMVEFYNNLMSGKSKHQSLRDAQKYLREVDNGKYDDPKYWAAFIMLDGID